MKKARKPWLKCFNYLLSGILILLGFPSCLDDNGNPGDILLEYGQPHAKYTIKGKVVNEKSEVVPDIQLIIKGVLQTTYNEEFYSADTLYSDLNGKFEFTDAFASPRVKYRIIHRDINKEGNIRKYKTDSIPVTMSELTGASGNWFEGSADAEVTIKLKEKTSEENGSNIHT